MERIRQDTQPYDASWPWFLLAQLQQKKHRTLPVPPMPPRAELLYLPEYLRKEIGGAEAAFPTHPGRICHPNLAGPASRRVTHATEAKLVLICIKVEVTCEKLSWFSDPESLCLSNQSATILGMHTSCLLVSMNRLEQRYFSKHRG